MRIHFLPVLFGVLLAPHATAHSSGQENPAKPAPQQVPAIRTRSQLVLVNVSVRDGKGESIRDLRKEDFSIEDEGHEQAVRFFTPPSTPAPSKSAPADPLPANTFSNHLDNGGRTPSRVTIILFDALNTPASEQSRALEQLSRVIHQLQPGDRVALYALGNSLRVLHEFTSDTSSLLKSFATYSGENAARSPDPQGPMASGYGPLNVLLSDLSQREKEVSALYRSRTTLAALEAIARRVTGVSGRKNLIWLTGAFPLSLGMEFDEEVQTETDRLSSMNLESTEINARITPRSLTRDRRDMTKDVERLAHVMNQNNVAVFPVDTRGLVVAPIPTEGMGIGQTGGGGRSTSQRPPSGQSGQGGGQGGQGGQNNAPPNSSTPPPAPSRAGPGSAMSGTGVAPNSLLHDLRATHMAMAEVATATGGRAFYNTNGIDKSIRVVLDEPSDAYVLGFVPDHNEWNDKFHRLKVRVKRTGVKMTHRRGYVALRELPNENPLQKALTDISIGGLDATGIGMRIELGPAKDALEAVVFLDPHPISLTPQGDRLHGSVTIAYLQMNAQGRVINRLEQTMNLRLKPEDYKKILEGELTLEKRIPITSGATTLRIVALDQNAGNMGSVSIPLANVVWK